MRPILPSWMRSQKRHAAADILLGHAYDQAQVRLRQVTLSAYPLALYPLHVAVKYELVHLHGLRELPGVKPALELLQGRRVVDDLEDLVREQTAMQGQGSHLALHLVRLGVQRVGQEVQELFRQLPVQGGPVAPGGP